MIMIINVRVHVWAQKLITYFKTVCVGRVFCVRTVQIAYRDTPNCGEPPCARSPFRGSSQQQPIDRLISGPDGRNAGSITRPVCHGLHKQEWWMAE